MDLLDDKDKQKKKPGVDTQAFKHAISMVESSGGKNLSNSSSSASGKYHFLYKSIANDPDMIGVSKREFMNNEALQEKIMDKAINGELKDYAYGINYSNKLKKEYNSNFSTDQMMALVHFLGSGNARKYLSNPESFDVPGKNNATVLEYMNRYNKYMGEYNLEHNTKEDIVQQPQQQLNPQIDVRNRAMQNSLMQRDNTFVPNQKMQQNLEPKKHPSQLVYEFNQANNSFKNGGYLNQFNQPQQLGNMFKDGGDIESTDPPSKSSKKDETEIDPKKPLRKNYNNQEDYNNAYSKYRLQRRKKYINNPERNEGESKEDYELRYALLEIERKNSLNPQSRWWENVKEKQKNLTYPLDVLSEVLTSPLDIAYYLKENVLDTDNTSKFQNKVDKTNENIDFYDSLSDAFTLASLGSTTALQGVKTTAKDLAKQNLNSFRKKFIKEIAQEYSFDRAKDFNEYYNSGFDEEEDGKSDQKSKKYIDSELLNRRKDNSKINSTAKLQLKSNKPIKSKDSKSGNVLDFLETNNFKQGGQMQNSVGDARDLVTLFEGGGTHEQNQYGGIPQGIGANGKPNLVEEGETKWNDYIFSNSISLDGKMNLSFKGSGKNYYKIGGKIKKY